jgi:hypothetical protein
MRIYIDEVYVDVLDSTRVHPAAYDWARKMANDSLSYLETDCKLIFVYYLFCFLDNLQGFCIFIIMFVILVDCFTFYILVLRCFSQRMIHLNQSRS